MANERITENIVREHLKDLGYYDCEETTVEEQKSQIYEIKKLLKGASKTGKGGSGAPEFIVTSSKAPDFIIIFECKAENKHHVSPNKDKPIEYAVDGVIHYARPLSKSYNVICVAASGQTKSGLKVTNLLFPKGADVYKPLTNKSGK